MRSQAPALLPIFRSQTQAEILALLLLHPACDDVRPPPVVAVADHAPTEDHGQERQDARRQDRQQPSDERDDHGEEHDGQPRAPMTLAPLLSTWTNVSAIVTP